MQYNARLQVIHLLKGEISLQNFSCLQAAGTLLQGVSPQDGRPVTAMQEPGRQGPSSGSRDQGSKLTGPPGGAVRSAALNAVVILSRSTRLISP